jgi:N-acetyl-beta-hexosaminidase
MAHQRGPTYSRQALDTVVRFAAEHGVRVVVEIDMPGHAGR